MCWKVHSRFLCIASLSCHSLTRQLGCGSAFRASIPTTSFRTPSLVIPASEPESTKRSFVRPCSWPLPRLLPPAPLSWVRLRANWAAVRPSVQASPPVIPASERESIKRGLMRSWSRLRRGCPRRRRCTQRLYHPRQRLASGSPPTPRFWFAYAPIGLRFGNPCKHGCAHLAPIVPARWPA